MSRPDPNSRRKLAALMDLADQVDGVWLPQDLAGVLRHQLNTALLSDLSRVAPPDEYETIRTSTIASNMICFADLFDSAEPPVELLELAKRFAKTHRNHPDSPLPLEVATVLYYACIAAALVRRGKRITELSNADLRVGFTWCTRQNWLDDRMRPLFSDSLSWLNATDHSEP